jgi:hypothetical protein
MLATEGAIQLSEKDNAVLQRNDTHSSAVTKAHYEKFRAYDVAKEVCVCVCVLSILCRIYALCCFRSVVVVRVWRYSSN